MITSSVSLALEVAAAEQRTEDRQVAEAGELGDRLADAVLQHAAHDQRPAGGQLERALGAAHLEAGDGEVVEGEGPVGGQFRHLGLDAQADAAFGEDDRREAEGDAEGLELDGDVARRVLAGGNRELAAGEEGRGLAGDGGQRRLGERRIMPVCSSARSVADRLLMPSL